MGEDEIHYITAQSASSAGDGVRYITDQSVSSAGGTASPMISWLTLLRVSFSIISWRHHNHDVDYEASSMHVTSRLWRNFNSLTFSRRLSQHYCSSVTAVLFFRVETFVLISRVFYNPTFLYCWRLQLQESNSNIFLYCPVRGYFFWFLILVICFQWRTIMVCWCVWLVVFWCRTLLVHFIGWSSSVWTQT